LIGLAAVESAPSAARGHPVGRTSFALKEVSNIRFVLADLPCGAAAHSRGVFVMGKRLYVGNLSYEVTDSALSNLFGEHGNVQSAQVVMDRDTGRSKGFGFVEMGSDQEAQAAIAALNGKESGGRSLTVNEARPKSEGSRGGSGGRGGSGYGSRRY
jgi:RNA recognition motif-containing protein